jgi:hypothetical protein
MNLKKQYLIKNSKGEIIMKFRYKASAKAFLRKINEPPIIEEYTLER